MHELAVAKRIARVVVDCARQNRAAGVTDIYLRIGALRGIIGEWVRRYFVYASRGTVAEGALLHIDRVPGSVICRCGAVTPLEPGHLDDVACRECGGTELRLWSGREFTLVGIGVREKGGLENERHPID
ncbi:hydrogenase maturation nickel metallochaperone HypA [Solidesulfovibrio sp.]|uniref:hydrogenase maturation nickel metallochaperone HypA/HybF n=1 Tax=Solidesulfovibrio sp. TaxID=2910990 RepID=UPI002B1F31D5|nr:hydrogenase maturation nickel metallochaperone HypA [Solidesulfovibrio sp.]MEA4858339.1 hydrogenase maturation nickel metallochaperone HypA [Solidesulfovibrio sp.]